MATNGRTSLPAKLYFRIGEVAELVGVEPHVLRYWEREFRSIRPSKSAKGQRVYSRRDVESLMRVRELLYAQGFTIAGAKKRLQRSGVEPDELDAPRESAANENATDGPMGISAAAPVAVTVTTAPAALGALGILTPGSLAPGSLAPGSLAPGQALVDAGHAAANARMREQLIILRTEVSAFLEELGDC